MAWLYSLKSPEYTAAVFGLILVLDFAVWIGTKQAERLGGKDKVIDLAMGVLGSWPSLIAMGAVTVWLAFWSGSGSRALDLGISIWTMLLDVLVIIGANYTRRRDRAVMKGIEDRLDRLLKKRPQRSKPGSGRRKYRKKIP